MLFLEACLAGLVGSGLVLLHLGLVWLVLFRVTSLNLLPGYVLDFYIGGHDRTDSLCPGLGGVPSRH